MKAQTRVQVFGIRSTITHMGFRLAFREAARVSAPYWTTILDNIRVAEYRTVRFLSTEATMHASTETPRAAAKRAQIRTAAQSLFLKRGFVRTSTAAIAAEARVSKETLYAYYPHKDDLLRDVLRHSIERFSAQDLPEIVHGGTIGDVEALRRALHALAKQIIAVLMQPDYLSLARVIITETPHAPQLGLLFRSTVPEQVLGRVAAILEEAQRQNLVRVPDTSAAARMLVGSLLTFVLMNGLLVGPGEAEPPSAAQIDPIIDLFTRAVRE